MLHCAVNQRHIRRSRPTRDAALEDACSQLLRGHAVNRIIGPSETIKAHEIKEWCAKPSPESRLIEPAIERVLLISANLLRLTIGTLAFSHEGREAARARAFLRSELFLETVNIATNLPRFVQEHLSINPAALCRREVHLAKESS